MGIYTFVRRNKIPLANNIKEACKINKAQLNWLLKGLKLEKIEEKNSHKKDLF